jgi:excisionase family DNA binding protein
MNNSQNLLTVEMAADYLHCHPETVRRMIRRGELKAVKFRKFWRVPMEGLRRAENAALDAPTRAEPLTKTTRAKGLGELETMFDELNAEADKEGEPLPARTLQEYSRTAARTYQEREAAQ